MTDLAEDPTAAAEELVVRIGGALAEFGMPCHRLEDRLTTLTEHLGLTGTFFAVPTSLLIDLGQGTRHRVRLARIRPSQIDLGKLEDLHGLVNEVLDGDVGPTEAITRIDTIVEAPQRYGELLKWIGHLVASCAATRFLGGGTEELLLGTLAGAMLGTLALLLRRRPSASLLFEPAGAMTVALTAVLGAQLFDAVDVDKALLGGLIVLLPGFSIAIAVRELMSGHTAAGTIRMASAAMTTLMLGFGVALGYRLGLMAVGEPAAGSPTPLPLWTAWALLPVAALNVAMVFQVSPRQLGSVVITAALGYGVLTLAGEPLGRELAVFAGAFTVGVVGNLFARRRARPFGVARLPALLFLVPGGLGFLSIQNLFGGDTMEAMATAGQVALVATALVTGLMVADAVIVARSDGTTDAV
jgi:uncharacterized membrane protein YjjP (DUF1212 family)